MKTLPLLCVSLLTLSLAAAVKPATDGAEPGLWTMDFNAAKKVAGEKRLPILLNFTGSDWCGWCKHMDKEVFSQDLWLTYAKTNLLLVWIDFPKDKALVPEKYVARNKALSATYGVEGYPAYIVLDDDGQTTLGQLGADREIDPPKFIKSLESLFQNRLAVVNALLATLPPKRADEYRAAEKQKAAAQTELKKLETSFEKRRRELESVIAAQQKKLGDIRMDARLAKIPKDKADAYKTKKDRRDHAQSELDAWIATEPERNEENMKKFAAWREELKRLEDELSDLLKPE